MTGSTELYDFPDTAIPTAVSLIFYYTYFLLTSEGNFIILELQLAE